jgi:hypothetical protein
MTRDAKKNLMKEIGSLIENAIKQGRKEIEREVAEDFARKITRKHSEIRPPKAEKKTKKKKRTTVPTMRCPGDDGRCENRNRRSAAGYLCDLHATTTTTTELSDAELERLTSPEGNALSH